MKRVTILFDQEELYREVKAAAARQGRPVKDVVAEALQDWLRRRPALSEEDRTRRAAALLKLDEIRARQPFRQESVVDDLEALRDERS